MQWLYLGYLAGVKEQNGAAMSLGRTSTFLDIYFERDLAPARSPRSRRRRSSTTSSSSCASSASCARLEYDELFAGDPTWVTESIAGMGDDGRSLVTKTSFRFLQTLYNLGPAPEPNLTIWYSPRLPDGFRRFADPGRHRHELTAVRERRDHAPRLGRRRGDRLLRVADGRRQADAVLRRRANLAKCLLYAINGGRDEISGDQVGPASNRSPGDVLDFDDVIEKFERMMDWLAGVYVMR